MTSKKPFLPEAAASSNKFWAFSLGSFLLLAALGAYFLFESLLPLFFAFGLAYAFGPLVDQAERHGRSRSSAALMLILGLCIALGLLAILLLPALLAESREFSETFPNQVTVLVGKIAAYGNRQGLSLPVNQELAAKLGVWTHDIFTAALASGFGSGGRIFASVSGVVEFGFGLLIVPVFFFYLLRDLPAMKRQVLDLVPQRHRPAVVASLKKVDGVFSAYIRGQLTVALILAGVFAAGLTLMGVRYGLVIGIFSGLLNLVPYLGQILGALASLLMVMVEFKSWGRVLAIPVFFSAVNFIEGNFVTPRIVGGRVGLSSLQTLVALFVGADIGGLLGMVVAIPLAASFKVLILDMHQEYKTTRFYNLASRPRRPRHLPGRL